MTEEEVRDGCGGEDMHESAWSRRRTMTTNEDGGKDSMSVVTELKYMEGEVDRAWQGA